MRTGDVRTGSFALAEASGDRETARDYYAKLLTLTVNRDTKRPELNQAEAFLQRH
jgi:hypothetical protein